MSTLDFLNQGLDSQAGHQSSQNYTREGVYAPKLKDAPSGTYKAKLRFLPNMTDPSKTFNGLIFYRFRDAFGENTIYIPSKKNWGERCPISELGFKLKKSPDPAEQALKDNVYYYKQYYSYVQIVEDEIHPELNGKIMVFKYGNQIFRIIEEEINDAGGKIGGVVNPETGAEFILKITEVSGFTNYSASKFIPSQQPVMLNGKALKATAEDCEVLRQAEEALGITVDIDNHPWFAEDARRVQENLATYKQGGSVHVQATQSVETVMNAATANARATAAGVIPAAPKPAPAPAPAPQPQAEPDLFGSTDDDLFGDMNL